MPKHPPKITHSFYYKDIESKIFCPNCHRIVTAVVPATTVTYMVHSLDDICAVDWQTLFEFGPGVVKNG